MAFTVKTRRLLIVGLILGWSLTLLYSFLGTVRSQHWRSRKKLYQDNRVLMGTFWQVSSPNRQAAKIVFAEVSRIEGLLSKYNPGSEVWQLNQRAKLQVSPETFYVIQQAYNFWLKSGGAFDITVAALVDLWGFTQKVYQVPSDEELRTALKLVGSDKIILHQKDNVVEFKIPGIQIDLGAIAKGYALDCAVKKLKENNIASCLINAGGQVYALGDKFGQAWKIAIRSTSQAEIAAELELKDACASTSGNYEQFFFKDGKRYCHILNPETGYPADSGIASVTVVAKSGLIADALSTAIFILGEEKKDQLIQQFPEVKCYIQSGNFYEKRYP